MANAELRCQERGVEPNIWSQSYIIPMTLAANQQK